MWGRPQSDGSDASSELCRRRVTASPYSGNGHHPGLRCALNTGSMSRTTHARTRALDGQQLRHHQRFRGSEPRTGLKKLEWSNTTRPSHTPYKQTWLLLLFRLALLLIQACKRHGTSNIPHLIYNLQDGLKLTTANVTLMSATYAITSMNFFYILHNSPF